jgi:hypothetical protein
MYAIGAVIAPISTSAAVHATILRRRAGRRRVSRNRFAEGTLSVCRSDVHTRQGGAPVGRSMLHLSEVKLKKARMVRDPTVAAEPSCWHHSTGASGLRCQQITL